MHDGDKKKLNPEVTFKPEILIKAMLESLCSQGAETSEKIEQLSALITALDDDQGHLMKKILLKEQTAQKTTVSYYEEDETIFNSYFYQLVDANKTDTIRRILDQCPQLLNSDDTTAASLLKYALRTKKRDIAGLIIEKFYSDPSKLINIKDKFWIEYTADVLIMNTPLHDINAAESLKIIKLILDKNPQLAMIPLRHNGHDTTLLHYAIKAGHLDIAQTLIDTLETHFPPGDAHDWLLKTDSKGDTALHTLARLSSSFSSILYSPGEQYILDKLLKTAESQPSSEGKKLLFQKNQKEESPLSIYCDTQISDMVYLKEYFSENRDPYLEAYREDMVHELNVLIKEKSKHRTEINIGWLIETLELKVPEDMSANDFRSFLDQLLKHGFYSEIELLLTTQYKTVITALEACDDKTPLLDHINEQDLPTILPFIALLKEKVSHTQNDNARYDEVLFTIYSQSFPLPRSDVKHDLPLSKTNIDHEHYSRTLHGLGGMEKFSSPIYLNNKTCSRIARASRQKAVIAFLSTHYQYADQSDLKQAINNQPIFDGLAKTTREMSYFQKDDISDEHFNKVPWQIQAALFAKLSALQTTNDAMFTKRWCGVCRNHTCPSSRAVYSRNNLEVALNKKMQALSDQFVVALAKCGIGLTYRQLEQCLRSPVTKEMIKVRLWQGSPASETRPSIPLGRILGPILDKAMLAYMTELKKLFLDNHTDLSLNTHAEKLSAPPSAGGAAAAADSAHSGGGAAAAVSPEVRNADSKPLDDDQINQKIKLLCQIIDVARREKDTPQDYEKHTTSPGHSTWIPLLNWFFENTTEEYALEYEAEEEEEEEDESKGAVNFPAALAEAGGATAGRTVLDQKDPLTSLLEGLALLDNFCNTDATKTLGSETSMRQVILFAQPEESKLAEYKDPQHSLEERTITQHKQDRSFIDAAFQTLFAQSLSSPDQLIKVGHQWSQIKENRRPESRTQSTRAQLLDNDPTQAYQVDSKHLAQYKTQCKIRSEQQAAASKAASLECTADFLAELKQMVAQDQEGRNIEQMLSDLKLDETDTTHLPDRLAAIHQMIRELPQIETQRRRSRMFGPVASVKESQPIYYQQFFAKTHPLIELYVNTKPLDATKTFTLEHQPMIAAPSRSKKERLERRIIQLEAVLKLLPFYNESAQRDSAFKEAMNEYNESAQRDSAFKEAMNEPSSALFRSHAVGLRSIVRINIPEVLYDSGLNYVSLSNACFNKIQYQASFKIQATIEFVLQRMIMINETDLNQQMTDLFLQFAQHLGITLKDIDSFSTNFPDREAALIVYESATTSAKGRDRKLLTSTLVKEVQPMLEVCALVYATKLKAQFIAQGLASSDTLTHKTLAVDTVASSSADSGGGAAAATAAEVLPTQKTLLDDAKINQQIALLCQIIDVARRAKDTQESYQQHESPGHSTWIPLLTWFFENTAQEAKELSAKAAAGGAQGAGETVDQTVLDKKKKDPLTSLLEGLALLDEFCNTDATKAFGSKTSIRQVLLFATMPSWDAPARLDKKTSEANLQNVSRIRTFKENRSFVDDAFQALFAQSLENPDQLIEVGDQWRKIQEKRRQSAASRFVLPTTAPSILTSTETEYKQYKLEKALLDQAIDSARADTVCRHTRQISTQDADQEMPPTSSDQCFPMQDLSHPRTRKTLKETLQAQALCDQENGVDIFSM
jgi:hypothetical protein